MKNDLKKVLNTFLNKRAEDNSQLIAFQNWHIKKLKIESDISILTKNIKIVKDKIKHISKDLHAIELKISKYDSKVTDLNNQINENENLLKQQLSIFKTINLYQLPLILNQKLKDNVIKNSDFLTIKDENELMNRLAKFHEALNSNATKDEFINIFYTIFKSSFLDFKTIFSKDDVINIFAEISKIYNKIYALKDSRNNLLENNSSFELKDLQIQRLKLLTEINDLTKTEAEQNDELEINNLNLKDIEVLLRDEFIKQRDQFSTSNSIQEITKQIDFIDILLEESIFKAINDFNEKLQLNLATFYKKYPTVQNIKIDNNFSISINNLELHFLSAGQRQILTFIFIKTVLEISEFFNTLFIDTPFGRLSQENRELIFEIYNLFPNLTLLLTNSEINSIDLTKFKIFKIVQNIGGSEIVS